MSGPAFFNLRTFSRTGNKSGQSVDQVLAEAERDPEYSAHVEKAKPPQLIFGMTIDEVRSAHSALLARRRTKVKVRGEIKERAIRKDRHTLAGCVMSYPVPREQVQANKQEWERYLEWRDLNLLWLKKLWGENLKSVVQHNDEPYLHLHALGLPETDLGCDARTMNPAYMRKRRVLEEEKALGKPNKEALKIANRAYRAAGRELQDEYYADVGSLAGLTRYGPRRRRLTRAEWHSEKERAREASNWSLRDSTRELVQQRDNLSASIVELSEEKAELSAELDQIKATGRKIIDQARNSAQEITEAAQFEQERATQEYVRLSVDRDNFESDAALVRHELDQRDVSLTQRERQAEVISGNLINAVENLGKAVGTAVLQRSGDIMTADKMGADHFRVLRDVSGKDEPTRLDWLRAWSLHASDTGHPLALPHEVVVALEGAFEKVADFSNQIGKLREQARLKGLDDAKQSAETIVAAARMSADTAEKSARDTAKTMLTEAAAQSEAIISSAEAQASTINAHAAAIMVQAREATTQADATLRAAENEAARLVHQEVRNRRLEPQARAWAAFATLLKEGVKAIFGEAGYQCLADWIKPRWAAHPDNPERPVERRGDWTAPRGPSP